MEFFRSPEPLLRRKQAHLDIQDRVGLLQLNYQIGTFTLSRFYTRIDQVFILWGLITALIFGIAQFFPLSWTVQALLWSGLTGIGTLTMALLSWFWVSVERLRWVVYGWAVLMGVGIILTDLGIWGGWWPILPYLCHLWLGLSALGYFGMGIGMQSRTFVLTGLLHLLSIALLPYVAGWQFGTTGAIMAGSLLLLSEMQWDMRPPIEFSRLTVEEQQFNREQHQLRQASSGVS
ncbi:MAG: hypothetical protein IGS38_22405 [Synechococcales cyanobacterium M58_A2018_015]|nr:hypothetical protein [Synechococcales cyanobacterium M58_A2018_015]